MTATLPHSEVRVEPTLPAAVDWGDAPSAPMPSSTHTTRPAHALYWAVIDGNGWTRTGPLPPGLLPSAQALCPVPLDEATHHAVCTTIGAGNLVGSAGTRAAAAGRLLVCVAPVAQLVDLDAALESLTPDAVPPTLLPPGADGRALASRLNLLAGTFEPQPVRRRRLIRHARAAAVAVGCALLVAVGLVRRERHAEADERTARAELWAIGERAPGGAAASALDDVEAEPAALVAALAESARSTATALRVARSADPMYAARHTNQTTLTGDTGNTRDTDNTEHTGDTGDAGTTLAALLASWPLRPEARLLSVSVSGERAALAITVQGDPAPLLRELNAPAGWTSAEPRISTSGSVARVSLELMRERTAPPTGLPAPRPATTAAAPLAGWAP